MNIPSNIKAIPVAVMLALSPMATQAQTHKPLTPKEAFELAESGKMLGAIKYKEVLHLIALKSVLKLIKRNLKIVRGSLVRCY